MENHLIQLSPEEQRVLGALIEKSISTPDYYPLTLNSLTTACNQKSARHPVVNYDAETVVLALNSLKKKDLCGTESGAYSRTAKYEHRFRRLFLIGDAELALICLLLLRGAQTPGELRANAGRLYAFDSIEEVNQSLHELQNADIPFVRELSRRPGQKENRYMHLFGGYEDDSSESENLNEEPARKHVSDLEQRVTQLEEDLETLRSQFEKLRAELE